MGSVVLRLSTLSFIAALSAGFAGCATEASDGELDRYVAKRRGAASSGAAADAVDDTVDEQSPSSGAPSTGTGPATGATPQGAAGFAQTCVDEINRFRATKGLPPYARWTEGESCADTQSATDGRTGRAHGAFGQCRENGQNECPGWDGAPETMIKGCLQMMWNEGPGGGHYDAMASRRYTMVSCGQAAGRGGTWSVQNFK